MRFDTTREAHSVFLPFCSLIRWLLHLSCFSCEKAEQSSIV